MGNLYISIGTIILFFGVVGFLYWRSRKGEGFVSDRDIDFNSLLQMVKSAIADLSKDEEFSGLSELELENGLKRKARTRASLKRCTYGFAEDREYVIGLITQTITSILTTEAEVLQIYNFNTLYLPYNVKFEILMYYYMKEFQENALSKLITDNNWDMEKYVIEDRTKASYCILPEDLDDAFMRKHYKMSYKEMVDVLAILIYQKYKGFGLVDTIDTQAINGYMIGTSGSTMLHMRGARRDFPYTQSCWLYFRGKYIHARFLDFGAEEEMRRVVQLLSRYNNPGALTLKRGFLINTKADQSRVLALRPDLADSWAIFIRKFSLSDARIQGLFNNGVSKNTDLPISVIRYLMNGQVTQAYTGRQGSGKTTLMRAVFEFADPRHNIRILETAPELYLRELFPERNILSMQETTTVTITQAQDASKKSDCAILVVGEVATDELAANMIKAARVASLYTLFSHHANTADDLVYGLRDSLVSATGANPAAAEKSVLDVIHINVDMAYTTGGVRYVNRITEIVPLQERSTYPQFDPKNAEISKAKIDVEFYTRVTDRPRFLTKNLIYYDTDNHVYKAGECPSYDLLSNMMVRMEPHIRQEFAQFVKETWGVGGVKAL